MRLLVLYLAQVAFLVLSFATICAVFVTLNGDATQDLAVDVVNTVVARLVDQATAPFETLSKQMVELAQTLAANPSMRAGNNSNALWNEPINANAIPGFVPSFDIAMNPLDAAMYAVIKANPLVAFVYNSFEMPDNSSQWGDRGVYFATAGVSRLYVASMKRDDAAGWPGYLNCDGQVNASEPLPLHFNNSNCKFLRTSVDPQSSWQLQTRAMTPDIALTGMWRPPYTWLQLKTNPPKMYALITFAIPIAFKQDVPMSPGSGSHCSEGLQMDVDVTYFNDALRRSRANGVDLVIFDDGSDSVLAWSVTDETYTLDSAGTVTFKTAAHTGVPMFDAALKSMRSQGHCGERAASCVAGLEPTTNHAKYIFAVRRIRHLNARFTVVVVGDKDTFMGRGIRARNAGISVSAVTCVVCLGLCLLLWAATVRPLRALIANMRLAAVFDASAKADATSCLTEVQEANAAFDEMHEQLQAARPFLPRHLLAQLEERRRQLLGIEELSDRGCDDETDSDAGRNHQPRTKSAKREFDTFSNSSTIHPRSGTATLKGSKGSKATSKRSSEGAVGKSLFALENRAVAVLIVNIREFHVGVVKSVSPSTLQADYAAFVTIINEESHRHRGVLDAAQGDHFIVSFNSSTHCNSPGTNAVRAAFAIRQKLQQSALSAAWQNVTMGVARGRAMCGDVGNNDMRTHATFGAVVRQALCFQRYSRALMESAADCWLVGAANVLEEAGHVAHYRYVATAVLPPTCTSRFLIAAIFPPVGKRTGDEPLSPHSEWLYELDSLQRSNPHAQFNADVLSKWAANEKEQAVCDVNGSNSLNLRIAALSVGIVEMLAVEDAGITTLHAPEQ
jgi:class 3 adenylate cyclase